MIDGSDRAERNTEQHAHQERYSRELQGRGQPLPYVQRHRPVRVGTLAKIEARDLAKIDDELLVERPVEAVLVPDLGDLRGRRVLARERGRRIRRHDADEEEGQDQKAEQRGDRQQEAA